MPVDLQCFVLRESIALLAGFYQGKRFGILAVEIVGQHFSFFFFFSFVPFLNTVGRTA